MKYVEDLGLYTIDRGRSSCVHRTSFCRKHCYNNKFYRWQNVVRADRKLNQFWRTTTGERIALLISRKRRKIERIRLCSRGDPFAEIADITRIIGWASANPDILFKAPTRAWRDSRLRGELESLVMSLPNVRLLASTDPTTTREEWDTLIRSGWTTFYFGDVPPPATDAAFKCPKTWKHIKGACAVCAHGCFSEGQTQVWLKMHA